MQSHEQTKRRKKRVLQGHVTKTVTVVRGQSGYGFTISGQNPCVLSCIVSGSPAHAAGLKAGDLLLVVKGQNVSKACHDDVVRMVGLSTGSLELQVAENYNSSDSSDDDYLPRTKSRYPNRVRAVGSLEEKGLKQDRFLSTYDPKQKSSPSDKLYNPCGQESDLSSSLTSQEDHVWISPAGVGWYEHGDPPRSEREQHLIGDTEKQRHELTHSNFRSQPVISTAKKISLAASVKLVPPVTSSVKLMPSVTGSVKLVPSVTGSIKLMPSITDSVKLVPAVTGSAKLVPSVTGRVKLVPPVTDCLKQVRHKDLKKQQLEGSQPDVSARLQVISQKEKNRGNKEAENVQAIVGYIGSIETPSCQSRPHQRLQALAQAVRRLRLEKRVHTLVLMDVCQSGISLTNAMGKQLALYPSDRIAFSGICPDDERFFGVVTLSATDLDSSSYLGEEGDILRAPNCTCHIFMVVPEISSHSQHIFQIGYKGAGQSDQFPRSATSLIFCIANLYRDMPSRKFDRDFVQSQAFTDLSNQSEHCSSARENGCLGLEKDQASLDHNQQSPAQYPLPYEPMLQLELYIELPTANVCVVDMSGGRDVLSVNTSLLWPGLDDGSQETFFQCPINCTNSEDVWQPATQPANKLTPQAMPDPTGLEVGQTDCSEVSLRQSMQRFLQARQQLLEEQNCLLGSDGESCIGDHVISLCASHDGHAVLEASNKDQWYPPDRTCTFAVPLNPAPTSIHHMAGRSAFHLLRSTSAPLGAQRNKPETVDLEAAGKFSPHSPPPSSAFFRSPSAPPAPFFPHRDSEEEDGGDESQDDPYIHQFNKDGRASTVCDDRRLSDGFPVSKKVQREAFGGPGVHKWTTGSFRRTEVALLKQSFSHSLELLTVDDGASSATQRLMNACSVNNVNNNAKQHAAVTRAGRVASWAVHFDKLLKDQLGIDAFTEFLEKEFSDENIRFWKVCEQFRNLPGYQRKVQAQDIYEHYLSTEAREPINIDTTARSYTETFLHSPSSSMFDVALHQILQLMRQDSYPRFLKSDVYKDMLLKEMADGQRGFQVSENSCDLQQITGKENGGKRRRSILPWRHDKSAKVTADSGLKKLTKKGTNNQLIVKTLSYGTTTTNISSSRNNNNDCGNMRKPTGLGIDLSTMRKEIFHQTEESQVKFCRIIMPDGSTTVVCTKSGQTCLSVIRRLCEKRAISTASVDVFLLGSDKPLNLNEDISTLGSKEVVVEKRVMFRLDLPDGKSVAARIKAHHSIRNGLKPILDKNGYNVDNICVRVTSCSDTVDLDMESSVLDNQRVIVITDQAGTHKRRVPLFGLFRMSEKRSMDSARQHSKTAIATARHKQERQAE